MMNCTLFCTNHFQSQIYHCMPTAHPPNACHTPAAPCRTHATPQPHPHFLVLQITHLVKCNTNKYSMNWAQYTQQTRHTPGTRSTHAPLTFAHIRHKLPTRSAHTQYSLSTCYVHTPCTLSTQSPHSVHMLPTHSPHIFLGIANYPFGKMQYQQ